ncbi:MAG: AAA family ATPase [Candidatus Omnitrophica bacterium]|nr:AAA family ATPase [Candidatus Omnitrophota bacterium]
MYCQFYGLKERPFNVTSDPTFFYLSRRHKEALSHLLYGTSQRKGITVITGEVGAGKTTLCRYFLSRVNPKFKTAFILNPCFSELELLEAILKDFGIAVKVPSKLSLVSRLNAFLLRESNRGNNIVLIIDEAQNLGPSELEQVRLLSNLETEKDKLLQIVLAGQPELNQKLNLPELKQLQQRVMVRYHMAPLEPDEVKDYVEFRLSVAGRRGAPFFSGDSLKIIADFSGGIPRLINLICDRALLAGYAGDTRIIGEEIINQCVKELEDYSPVQSV